jgi:dihydropteroate synthase
MQSEIDLLLHAETMIKEGADILDIGGQSTRPGAQRLFAEEEMTRVLPAIHAVRKHFPSIAISVDTFYSEVAREAAKAGADIINDVSGGSIDAEMFKTAAALNIPYVLTHIQGEPQTMQNQPQYTDVVGEVLNYFTAKIEVLCQVGVKQIILDPGFGFGKKHEHNLQLLNEMHLFSTLGYPLLAGLSRKKTLQTIIGSDAAHALNITTSANTIALMHGASILRVHDVREAKEAVQLYHAMMSA